MNSEQINDWLNRSALYIALLVAWVATLGSLYFSEVMGFIPCQLCWYQRIFMYPMAGLLALGLLRSDTHLPHLVIPFTLVGGSISVYHYLLQKTSIFDSAATCAVGVPCTTAWINWFGFVTIPFLALLAFFLITVFSLVALFAEEPQREEGERIPWLQVSGVVVGVLAVFSVMALMHEDPNEALAMSEMELAEAPALSSPAQSNTGGDGAMSETRTVAENAQLATGKALYSQTCAACHGPDATGIENLGSSLAESEVLAMSDDEALAFMREGIALTDPDNSTGIAMPGSGGRPELTDAEVMSILAYLRALSQGTEP